MVLATILLTDSSHDLLLNAEAATHLWYSARLPKHLFKHIQRVAGVPLRRSFEDWKKHQDQYNPDDTFSSEIDRKDVMIWIDLTGAQWEQLIGFLDPPSMTIKMAQLVRQVDARKRHELSIESQLRMTRGRAACMERWIDDGLLLPYGHPRSHFDTLNP